MPATAHLHLPLSFEQVLHLVQQLPKKQQWQLADIISKEETPSQNFSDKEQVFLNELEEAVDFVNNYPPEKAGTSTFKQMLDAL